MGTDNFWGEGACHCKIWGRTTVICEKTAEPSEMPFELLARVGRRNHVLDWGSEILRDVATAIIFGFL